MSKNVKKSIDDDILKCYINRGFALNSETKCKYIKKT